MSASKDKIGISIKTSVLLILIGLIITFFPENIFHPLVYTIGNAFYFFGTIGLILNIISRQLENKNKILIVAISLILSIGVMILTYQIHEYFPIQNSKEIKSNGITTNAIIKNVYTTTSLKGRKNSYADIQFTANEKTYNITIDIDKEALKYHEINDTIIIKYSKNNPYNFEIIENRNKQLKEDINKLSDYMAK
jgi:uncharacterized membrane protein YeiB